MAEESCIRGVPLEETGFYYTMGLISGKYKLYVLYTLAEQGTVRFNALRRYLGAITFKTLSATLKELERDGLVSRREYPQVPPRVEYSLTERGASLIPILDGLCEWGEVHR